MVGLPGYEFDLFGFPKLVQVVEQLLDPNSPVYVAEVLVASVPFILLILAGVYLFLQEERKSYEVTP